MKVINDSGNLVYDSSHPMYSIKLCQSQGELFAFVTALYLGFPSCRLSQPIPKRCWGKFCWSDEKVSMLSILEDGGKWPDLNGGIVK